MPTKQKTCGAERAANAVVEYGCWPTQFYPSMDVVRAHIAEYISRETHDAEMLEELKYMVRFYKSADHDRMAAGHNENRLCPICRAEALIAKVEE